jgi:hypothetical protein
MTEAVVDGGRIAGETVGAISRAHADDGALGGVLGKESYDRHPTWHCLGGGT